MVKSAYLTIVITYYNIRFLEETLASLKNQSDKKFKVLIANDKSPDDPKDLIDKYLIGIDYEYVSFENNLGGEDLTKQWKRCLDHVKTPYFLILGDDDFLSLNTVKSFNEMMKCFYGQKVFRLTIQRIDKDSKKIGNLITYVDEETSIDFIIKRSKYEVKSSLGEYIFLLDKYKEYGIRSYPKAFFSDNMMVLEFSDFGKIKNIENAISYIRTSEFSISGNKNNISSVDAAGSIFFYELLNEYSSHFINKNIDSFIPWLFYGLKEKSVGYNEMNMISLIIRKIGFRNLINYYVVKLKNFSSRKIN